MMKHTELIEIGIEEINQQYNKRQSEGILVTCRNRDR